MEIATRKILLQEMSENGLYPMKLGIIFKNKTNQLTVILGIKALLQFAMLDYAILNFFNLTN